MIIETDPSRLLEGCDDTFTDDSQFHTDTHKVRDQEKFAELIKDSFDFSDSEPSIKKEQCNSPIILDNPFLENKESTKSPEDYSSSLDLSDNEELWNVANEINQSMKNPTSPTIRKNSLPSSTNSSPSPIRKPPSKKVCKYIITSSSPRKSQSSPIKPPSQLFNIPVRPSSMNRSPSLNRYSSLNYSTIPQYDQLSKKIDFSHIPQLDQPHKKHTDTKYHTLLLATQKPMINDPMTHSQSIFPTKKNVKPLILSFEQECVLKQVLSGTSLFYTGCAGTGKSVLLRSIIKELKNKFNNSGVAVTASTGLAACNIGGITLHSFAGMGLANGKVDVLVKKVKKNRKALKRWIDTKVLIIDEISMVDGDLLDKLNQVAKLLRKNTKPFGGIQIIACGDFYQLPPVVKKMNSDGTENLDAKTIFSFESDAWFESIEQTIILEEIFRQKGDQTFINMLNEIRDGKISRDSIEEFDKLKRPLDCSNGILPAELYPTRREVELANSKRLVALPGELVKYKSIDTGSLSEPQRSILLSNFLANNELFLKKNAQVMCIKNFDENLVNGSLGQVVDFVDKDTYLKSSSNDLKDSIKDGVLKDFIFNEFEDVSKCETTGELSNLNDKDSKKRLSDDLLGDFKNVRYPLVKFLLPDGVNTRTVVVEPEQWTLEDEDGKVLLSRVQFPLMLAWSLSIHKSQGQTLSKVKVDLRQIFENGQAYVALSRATSRQGLQVLNFNESKVMSHPKVVKFYRSLTRANEHRPIGQQKLNFKQMSSEMNI